MSARSVGRGAALTAVVLVGSALMAPASATAVTQSGGGGVATLASKPAVEANCPTAAAGRARCFSLRQVNPAEPKSLSAHQVNPNVTPSGFGPADLASAYSIPANGGAGQTVAIVDAYDDPNAESDLAAYRTQFGLPACTTVNLCFSKVNQTGGTTYPSASISWSGEISLDLDMVSAIAPAAHILLVEADDDDLSSLAASVDEAVALGAKFVSNSYGDNYDDTPGSGEDPSEVTDFDPHYNHPGVAIVASSGDSAYGVSYPATSQYVTDVGGTSLVADASTRGWSESVWNDAYGGPGSGCSLYEAKPSWQTDSGCDMRMGTDVSAVADPLTGVAVYNTYSDSGWDIYGGTSASSPIIAATYADAGTPEAGTYPSSYLYGAGSGAFNDVTSGNNGSCTPDYYCTAETGYDGPTGLGTPDGLSAFSVGSPQLANPGSQLNTAGDTVNLSLVANSGATPYSFFATGLPVGLTIDSSTGIISGTVTTAGPFAVTATVKDLNSKSSSVNFSWQVNPGTATGIEIVSGSGQSAVFGHAFALPLVTTVTDTYGNPVPGQTVTYRVTSGPAAFDTHTTVTSVTDPAGQATSPTLTAKVATGAVKVSATISGGAATLFSETVTAGPTRADLSVTESGPASLAVGHTATIKIVIHNPGPNVASGITTTINVGAHLTIVTAPGGSHSGSSATFTLASMARGGARTYTITVRATGTGTGTITGVVSAVTLDPYSPNNHVVLAVHLH